jgi:hypothetical protein
MAGLVGASALALAIAAVQLLPIVESARQSYRAAESEGFHDIYPFSVSPLQLVEGFWPDLYGTVDRGNRSWFVGLPPKHEENLWMPSLYLGGLTLVLASAGAGLRRGPPWRGWLTGLAAVSLLGALGSYGGPLPWARCVPGWDAVLGPLDPAGIGSVRHDGCLRDGDGSVYWLLANGVPAMRSFRYPAKLLVFTALAVCGLAGAGWDELVAGRSRRARVVATGLLTAGVAATAAVWLGGGVLRGWFEGRAEALRSVYGPFDVAGAISDLRRALLQGTLAQGAALGLAVLARRHAPSVGSLAVAALALDLGLANARHVVTVPQAAFEGTPRVLKIIEEAERLRPSPGPFRYQRVNLWWPEDWNRRGSPRRAEEIVRWERDTLRPLYQLPLGVESAFFFDTTERVDIATMFLPWVIALEEDAAHRFGMKAGQKVVYHPRRGADLWNTRYFVVPSYVVWDSQERGYAAFVPQTTQVYPAPGTFDGPGGTARRTAWQRTEDVRVLRNEAALPRAWIVHQARVFPPPRGIRRSDSLAVLKEVLFQDVEFVRDPSLSERDPRRIAWVETDRPGEVARYLSRAEADPAEGVTVARHEPQRVELDAVLRSPGLVVLADAYDPGWTLEVDDRPAEVLRTNRAMREAAVDAGRHRLVFRYEPRSFRIGAAVSTAGLAALTVLGILTWRGRAARVRVRAATP